MAMGSLGSYHYYHHDWQQGRRYFESAFARAHRLSEWERLQLARSWAGYRGARDSAIVLARQIADRYPTAATWYDLGTALRQASRCDEGLPAFARALTFDSSFVNAHLDVAVCLRHSRPAEALGHFLNASRFDPSALLRGNIAFEYGSTLVSLSLGDSARAHFARLLDQPGMYERILGYRGLAWLALFGGLPRDAAGHFASATGIARQQDASLSVARGLFSQARALLAAGDSSAARQAFGQMMAVSRSSPLPPPFLAVFGHGLAAARRLGDAEALLQQLRNGIDSMNQADQGAEHLLEASLALARGNGGLALERLDQVQAFPQPALVPLLRAEALELMGRPDSAQLLRASVSKDAVWGVEAAFDWLRRVQR
jgi:tetratricopeptide (TPR) repeat protein